MALEPSPLGALGALGDVGTESLPGRKFPRGQSGSEGLSLEKGLVLYFRGWPT